MDKQQLIAALNIKKEQGMAAREAALAVWQEIRDRAVGVSPILLAMAQALRAVFRLSPRQLAIVLKALGCTDEQVAVSVRKAIQDEGGDVSAVDLGAALLDKDVYPQTGKERMKVLLAASGYTEVAIAKAVKILYPLIFVVQAAKPWQDTGVSLENDELALIEHISGTWNISPGVRGCGPQGSSRYIAKDGYAMPGQNEGALVGRQGGQVFLVGSRAQTPSGKYGKLELCPNDDLDARYGQGLADNSGSISVRITVSLR